MSAAGGRAAGPGAGAGSVTLAWTVASAVLAAAASFMVDRRDAAMLLGLAGRLGHEQGTWCPMCGVAPPCPAPCPLAGVWPPGVAG